MKKQKSGRGMPKIYDVIVVGAGPAGLMVAEMVAGSGLQVLLVEQKRDIARVFRSCCCNLIVEEGTHAESVSYADGALHFAANKFSVPYSGAVIPLVRSVKMAPGGHTLTIQGGSPEGAVAVSYEKEALLKDFYRRIRRMRTVEIMNETQATGAENIRGGVRVDLRTRDSRFSVRGRVAVAADGVNSRIVESLGLNRTRRRFFARFKVASYHMENVDCPYPESWITFTGKGHTMAGRGQLYMCPKPHEGRTDPPVYELTIGAPYIGNVPGPTPRDELDHFVTKGRFAPWFTNMKIAEVRAATLNFYTPLVNPVEGRVVAVGDSAAFIETYVQGAVMYGFQAGRAIVRYLETGRGLKGYADSWGSSFEYNDPEEIKLATQGFGLHVLKDDDLDYLFSLTEGDVIKGFVNEFSDPVTTRTALLRHLDRVKKERPALGATMEKFGQVSVDDALQVK